MLKIIDKVRWEAAKAIFSASFGNAGGEFLPSDLACRCAKELVNSAIDLGWLIEDNNTPEDKLKIAIEALEKIASKKTYTRPVEAWYKDGNQLCLSCCQLIEDHDESCQLDIAAKALKEIAGDDNEIPKN